MHWSDRYIGEPYVDGEQDCAYWAERMMREVFGKQLDLPREHAHGYRAQAEQILSLKDSYAEKISKPVDGCGVLMIGRGRMSHIGLYCHIDGAGWVVHAMKGAGIVRHSLRSLGLQGLTVEGFYRWT